jgi:hypothetical protein
MKKSWNSRLLLIAWLGASACSSTPWNEPVATWGTMREVMHDGRTEGRVRLGDAAAAPDAIGLGALAGLSGEIVILDGAVWTSRRTAIASRRRDSRGPTIGRRCSP